MKADYLIFVELELSINEKVGYVNGSRNEVYFVFFRCRNFKVGRAGEQWHHLFGSIPYRNGNPVFD